MASRSVTYRLALLLAVATAAGAGVAGVALAVGSASGTYQLNGHFYDIRNFGGPGCGSVTGVCSAFEIKGTIQGEGTVFVDTFPTADGISKAHTVIRTKDGELTCTEAAIFDLVGSDHAFVDLCVITGGTGRYAGASGYLQEVGTFDFAANRGEGHYHGKLVLP